MNFTKKEIDYLSLNGWEVIAEHVAEKHIYMLIKRGKNKYCIQKTEVTVRGYESITKAIEGK